MEKKIFNIPVYIYFIVLTILIVILFPRDGKFTYSFTEGRPWKYGLVTAPFDFPIYKTDTEIKKEQDSIIKYYRPYFTLDKSVAETQLNKFRNDNRTEKSLSYSYVSYIENTLKEIYNAGIISVENQNFLQENNYIHFMVFEDNIAIQHDVNLLFTVRSAYSYLQDNLPEHLDVNVIRSAALDKYLSENLSYDEVTSQKVKEDLLHQISPSSGLVQAGEKIIDRGEIVDNKSFNILTSLKKSMEMQSGTVQRQSWSLVGIFILVTSFMTFFYLYLYFFRQPIYKKNKDVFFLFSLMALFIFMTILFLNYRFSVYVIPYAIIPIIIRTFFDSRTARAAHTATILVCSLMIPYPGDFIILQFCTSMVVIFSLSILTKRSQLIKCSLFVLLTYVVTYVGLVLLQEGDITKAEPMMFGYFGINFLFLMFTYSFIYMVERVFGYTSAVTLVELSDINTPVLRKLSEVAPGTFQHSLQVSILGSAAAVKVGANSQLVRTGALYHDIGKIEDPVFFTENQHGNNNPHKNMPYEKSAQIITKHVTDGIRIAKKYNLPEPLIDFIRTHHGKGVAKYFYNSYKNEFPDQEIDMSKFTYAGPNPFSKEHAILMMADAVEAASRSLTNYNEESIRGLVNKIINSQINDGLLNDAPLTFKDIEDIKNVFIEKLMNIFHSRITYPELEKK